MMYLSHLLIDVGSNPDRPRPGRFWLRNMYHVHQRLCMAFPSKERRKKERDPHFLEPYSPDDFPETRHLADQKKGTVDGELFRHVHAPRDSNSGFLFRLDPLPGASVGILILSAIEPDWGYAFHNAGYLLAAPPAKPRPMEVTIDAGSPFRFLLTANPVRKVSRKSTDAQGQSLDEEWIGKHVPVPADEKHLRDWLERRAEPRWTPPPNGKGQPPGFRLERIIAIQSGYVYFNKTRDSGEGRRLRSARYEGILEVTDSDHFRKTLMHGIGPAKAFGFGLLSITRARG
jgi:CRISPR system Cascade subunit CasE